MKQQKTKCAICTQDECVKMLCQLLPKPSFLEYKNHNLSCKSKPQHRAINSQHRADSNPKRNGTPCTKLRGKWWLCSRSSLAGVLPGYMDCLRSKLQVYMLVAKSTAEMWLHGSKRTTEIKSALIIPRKGRKPSLPSDVTK
jgi:hypothetical protein